MYLPFCEAETFGDLHGQPLTDEHRRLADFVVAHSLGDSAAARRFGPSVSGINLGTLEDTARTPGVADYRFGVWDIVDPPEAMAGLTKATFETFTYEALTKYGMWVYNPEPTGDGEYTRYAWILRVNRDNRHASQPPAGGDERPRNLPPLGSMLDDLTDLEQAGRLVPARR